MSSDPRHDNLRRSSPQSGMRNADWKSRARAPIADDEFDDDSDINTPNAVREATRSFVSGSSSKSGSSIFGKRLGFTAPPETPLRGKTSRSDNLSHIQRDQSGSNKENQDLSVLRHGGSERKTTETSPKRLLVDENNNLTPHPTALSPPRRNIVPNVLASKESREMEFDPSDHDSPRKALPQTKTTGKVQESVDANIPKPNSSKPSDEALDRVTKISAIEWMKTKPISTDRTPKRSSPLKNVVLPSSENRSTASSMIEEIRNSGALEPRSAQSISDQFQNSLRELEKSASAQGLEFEGEMRNLISESGIDSAGESNREGTEESESESDGESDSEGDDPLDQLNQYVPSLNQINAFRDEKSDSSLEEQAEINSQLKGKDDKPSRSSETNIFAHNGQQNGQHNNSIVQLATEPDENPFVLRKPPEVEPPHVPEMDTSTPFRDAPGELREKRKRGLKQGKLSGKYARKRLKEKQQRARTQTYKHWSADQWDKLQRLVDSSVPNNVIANSYIVMRELKCTDKTELALRIKFLMRGQQ